MSLASPAAPFCETPRRLAQTPYNLKLDVGRSALDVFFVK